MIYGSIMIIYLIVMLVVGLLVSRKISNAEDWMVAGRTLNIPLSVGTYFATIVSSVSVVGYMGYYYGIGWGGWWNWAGTAITTLLAAGFFATKIRRFGKVTLPDFLEERYGKIHALLGSIMIFMSTLFFTCAQLVGGSVLLNVTTGIPVNLSILLIGAVFIFFTIKGGMLAVAWTDTISSALILIGVWALMFVSLNKVGGFQQLHITLAEVNPNALDPFAGGAMKWGIIISWMVTWGLGNFGAPQFITRFYACKDERTARMSQGWTGLTLMFFYGPLMLAGLAGTLLVPGIVGSDQVAPTLIKELLNPVAGGIVMSAILAACISTADSVLLLAGTTAANDIYKKYINKDVSAEELLKISRKATLFIGIFAMIMTMFMTSTVMWIQATMLGLLGSTLAVSVIFGFLWKKSNSEGALAGMIVGIGTAILWYILGKPFGWFPILPAVITSAIANIVVSLATKPLSKEIENKFFGENAS